VKSFFESSPNRDQRTLRSRRFGEAPGQWQGNRTWLFFLVLLPLQAMIASLGTPFPMPQFVVSFQF
jgi:hypothetical protein